MHLYQKHRPQKFEDLVGYGKTLKAINQLRQRGIVGHAIWICGPSGAGKTTVSRILANEISDPSCIFEVDAQDLSLDQLREWESQFRGKPLFGKAWSVIVNESANLSSRIVSRFLTLLENEEVSRSSAWFFTTTTTSQKKLFDGVTDAKPFLSRANVFEFIPDKDVARQLAVWAQKIAKNEGLDGKPLSAYVTLVNECGHNAREILTRIESGAMLS